MVAFKQYASAMSCANFRRLRTFMLSEGSDPGDGETTDGMCLLELRAAVHDCDPAGVAR